MKKTKIVCTIGPATKDVGIIKEMILNGMNVARINFSHGNYDDQKPYINAVKQAREELNEPVAILLDTQGPEIRTGKLAKSPIYLETGNQVILTHKDILGTEDRVSITYSDLYKDVEEGTLILLDDGRIELKVEKILNGEIYCKILNGGEISHRRSVNIPNKHINLPALKEKDIKDLMDACRIKVDFISASFIRDEQDIRQIRKVLDENGGKDIKIISKIENREGINNFEKILKHSDGIMIARGDLGVEIPLEEVPIIQKDLIKECNRRGKFVITATQMLESMITNPRPTRAEVSDVANAIMDVTGAIMLSGESAIGKYPVECVKTMARIANTIEEYIDYWGRFKKRDYDLSKVNFEFNLNHSICSTAMQMKVKAIIAYTQKGDTPQMISSFLPECPIYVITSSEETYRQMSICWNTKCILLKEKLEPEEAIPKGIEKLKEMGLLEKGDKVVISGGASIIDGRQGNVMNRTIGGVLTI
ncbi:MAG: pyruvate kinase [Clostridia bacterium]|nr:pyruvate kinase [Clostridia bacterium]